MAREKIRIVLPKCGELPQIENQLRACGFASLDLSAPGIHRFQDPFDVDFDFEIFALATEDVGTYVQHGIGHVGVMSTDLIREAEVELWRPFTFRFGRYPLVLAAPAGHNMATLSAKPVLRLATPLPRFTREWFASRGIPIEVVSLTDSAETAVLLGLADAYVDRLSDPERLLDAGFRVLEAMGHTYLKLVVNNACGSRRRAAIQVIIEKLKATSPPEPPPIDIPFDQEDPI